MNRLTINLILIVLFLNIFSSSGQTKKEIKFQLDEGESYLLYEEYKDAIVNYNTLLSWFPENDNYKYRLGICYLNIPGQKEQSLPFLQQAVQNINPKYKDGRVKETASAYDAWYYLAKAYLVTNQIDKAITTYSTFLDGMDHKVYDSVIVKKELQACYNAKRLMEIPLYLKSVNQGGIINDRFPELNPVVSADEKTIVYTQEAQLQLLMFYSKKIDGEWTPGTVIMDQLLVDEGYTTSLSADGSELFLYRSDNYIGNIYSSNFEEGRWTPAVKLNENINTKYWESHAAISNDGQKLYFTSNRPEGYGGLDIYISDKDSIGEWGPAVNLGPTVNTPYNEETPFLNETDNVLFFSSRGHFSMGGHDIFYTTKLEDGTWAFPVNMGYPVNSTDDDTFFYPVGQGYSAYVSRIDPDGFGLQDIQRIEIFSDDHPRKFYVRGMVTLTDLISQFSDSVKISTLDKENLDTLLIVYSDPATGEYEIEVPQGDYKLVYESDGSERNVTDLEVDLLHPTDSVTVPELQLNKSDHVAELELVVSDSISAYQAGDTASILIMTEPNSILLVEHWQGDSLIKTEEFVVTESFFKYKTEALPGDNTLKFIAVDRFNNKTIVDYTVRGEEPEKVIIPEVIEVELIVAEQVVDTVKTEIETEVDPSIGKLNKILTEATKSGDNEKVREALDRIKDKNIRNAGEWFESIYSVALAEGADEESLIILIAALSAGLDESPEDYLARLAKHASGNLRRAIESFDMSAIDVNDPEGIIKYLLKHADDYGYTDKEVFEAFAGLIISDKKSAEDIVEYIDKAEKGKLWLLWILLGGGILIFFFFVRKKKKDEDD